MKPISGIEGLLYKINQKDWFPSVWTDDGWDLMGPRCDEVPLVLKVFPPWAHLSLMSPLSPSWLPIAHTSAPSAGNLITLSSALYVTLLPWRQRWPLATASVHFQVSTAPLTSLPSSLTTCPHKLLSLVGLMPCLEPGDSAPHSTTPPYLDLCPLHQHVLVNSPLPHNAFFNPSSSSPLLPQILWLLLPVLHDLHLK